ncbi:MAG: hypothetical protein KDI36_16250 [Pseudomonadales bacterium]|nr:hypothetical protein [Pseudomonadales bacterium]
MSRLTSLCLIALLLVLTACSSGDAEVEAAMLSAERRVSELESALSNGTVRNATIITQYASLLSQSRPELAPLLSELKKDATTQGPLFKSIKSRLVAVQDGTESFENWTDKVAELEAIQAAANIAVYNDALSDTVNVIADLSDGQFARVAAVSQEAELKMNQAEDFGAGSQYIGNPHYGYWSHGAGGSFWAWYGQYHFFSSLFGGRPYYYHDWAGRRGYSYYNDVGRNTYTSRKQWQSQTETENRARKQFGGSKFQSPYSRSRQGASGLSKQSTAVQKSAFRSSFSKSGSSSSSKFASGTRNSDFRTSKGVSRGK